MEDVLRSMEVVSIVIMFVNAHEKPIQTYTDQMSKVFDLMSQGISYVVQKARSKINSQV